MRTLPDIVLEPVVRAALLEDLGRAGDITTDAIVPPDGRATCAIVSRQAGVVSGADCARIAWRLMCPDMKIEIAVPDAARVAPGQVILTASGCARALLSAERVGLNLMGRMSGIATATARIADAIAHTKAHVVCTRKTTPGLRALEKYAVRCGGGRNHRFGLDDAVLIKDNHVAFAGGVRPAVEAVRREIGHMVKVEVEVDSLEQLAQLLDEPIDAVLLDNMGPDQLREAVRMVDGRFATEASGGITPETAPAIAEAGVDMLSVGYLTHSSPVLDLGLDWRE